MSISLGEYRCSAWFNALYDVVEMLVSVNQQHGLYVAYDDLCGGGMGSVAVVEVLVWNFN